MSRLPLLRMRLALRAFGLTLIALAVIVSLGWLAADRIIEQRIDTSAVDFLQTIVSELEISDTPTAESVAAPIVRPGEDRIAQIIDLSSGDVIIASRGHGDAPLIELDTSRSGTITTGSIPDPIDGDGQMVVKSTVSIIDGGRFGVVAGVSGNSLSLGSPLALAIALATLGVALGVASGVWISVKSAFRPVEALSNHADRIAHSGDTDSWKLDVEAATSEIQQLIDRLNSLLTRVHESQEHERAFLEDASHDLRTPIAVARAEIDLATSNTHEPETRMALISAIEELDRLDRLSADLLILAKMRSHPTPSRDIVHLGRLVRNTAGRMTRQGDGKGVTITVSGTAQCVGDEATVERALDNLIRNAIRHAATSVEVSIDSAGDSTIVTISDDGSGFPKEMLTSATDRFTRGEDRGEGTGLGLSIASAIVRAHGGSMTLGNRALGGAVVTIHIPSEKQAEPSTDQILQ